MSVPRKNDDVAAERVPAGFETAGHAGEREHEMQRRAAVADDDAVGLALERRIARQEVFPQVLRTGLRETGESPRERAQAPVGR